LVLRLVVGIYLPEKARQMNMEFFQQILEGSKGHLFQKNVNERRVPNWPEVSVARAWAQLESDTRLMAYLPDKKGDKMPPKRWFWGVVNTLRGHWCDAFLGEAAEQRKPKPGTGALFAQARLLKLSDAWIAELLRHDHKPKGKSSDVTS